MADPLDVRPFEERPCDLLTVEQLRTLGYADPEDQGLPTFEPPGRASGR